MQMSKGLALPQIWQDLLSEETQMYWKKVVFYMNSRVEGLNLVCADDLHLGVPWEVDVQ